jgi:hypothetical protein
MPSDVSAVREFDAESFAGHDIFRRTIAECAQPAVVRGAVRHWPVVRMANESAETLSDYLRKFASDALAEAFIGDSKIAGRYTYADDFEGFNFERVKVTLSDALARISANATVANGPTMYVGSLQTSIFLPGFAAENELAAVPKSVDPRIWIGNRSDVSCHNDTFDNIACVVSGRRRFTLYPPDAVADLYVGPVDYTMSGRPISLAAGAPADDPRYPRFAAAAARATSVELAPGDALYLPKLWWHQVEATEPFNMLVNYWWDEFSAGPDAPYTAMMLAMIAIAERPAAERAAWRAFFDHYVFRPDGHPLAHLPEEKHGILGPLAKGNYGRLRAIIMQLLRGG